MSFVKAAKWSIVYIILTLGFAAIAALGTFIFVSARSDDYEFGTLFFFSLFPTGISLILLGVVIILRVPKHAWYVWPVRLREEAVTAERKEGILCILTGFTLFLVWLTHYLLVSSY